MALRRGLREGLISRVWKKAPSMWRWGLSVGSGDHMRFPLYFDIIAEGNRSDAIKSGGDNACPLKRSRSRSRS